MKANTQNFEFLHCDFDAEAKYLNISASFGNT